jgi:hypothetical protein
MHQHSRRGRIIPPHPDARNRAAPRSRTPPIQSVRKNRRITTARAVNVVAWSVGNGGAWVVRASRLFGRRARYSYHLHGIGVTGETPDHPDQTETQLPAVLVQWSSQRRPDPVVGLWINKYDKRRPANTCYSAHTPTAWGSWSHRSANRALDIVYIRNYDNHLSSPR